MTEKENTSDKSAKLAESLPLQNGEPQADTASASNDASDKPKEPQDSGITASPADPLQTDGDSQIPIEIYSSKETSPNDLQKIIEGITNQTGSIIPSIAVIVEIGPPKQKTS